MQDTLISLPLDLPKLEPDDWQRWWALWDKHAQPVQRIRRTHNIPGSWVGFDVYRDTPHPIYDAPLVDLSSEYPSLWEQLTPLLTMRCYRLCFVQSTRSFGPHTDATRETWAIRALFHCQDPNPQWYYTDANYRHKTPLRLPADTNWWAYRDFPTMHGTDYRAEHPKILFQAFVQKDDAKKLVEQHAGKYPEYEIHMGNGS